MTELQLDRELSDHVVQFYEREEDLFANVAQHLGEGLGRDEVAIVIATTAHRLGFAKTMRDAGLDIESARSSGVLIELDAQETLERLSLDGAPEPAQFDEVIGGLVREAGADGRRVRAYGEMVALLWEAGHVQGAIALEELWNRLARKEALSLYCAYPATSMGEDDLAAFAEVCHLHSGVVGSFANEAARRFDCSVTSPRDARRFLGEILEAWNCPHLLDSARLVCSELATNAVVHAKSPFDVIISRRENTIRVTVRDDDSTPPRITAPLFPDANGRGLQLVSVLSSRWGHECSENGKVIWAEFAG